MDRLEFHHRRVFWWSFFLVKDTKQKEALLQKYQFTPQTKRVSENVILSSAGFDDGRLLLRDPHARGRSADAFERDQRQKSGRRKVRSIDRSIVHKLSTKPYLNVDR